MKNNTQQYSESVKIVAGITALLYAVATAAVYVL